METESSDIGMSDLPTMPEDAAAAWAGVLLDLMEKLSRQKGLSGTQADVSLDAAQGDPRGTNSDRREPI